MLHEETPKASGRGLGALWKTMVVAAVIASRIPSDATSMMRGDRDRWRIYTYRPRYRASATTPASRHDTAQLR